MSVVSARTWLQPPLCLARTSPAGHCKGGRRNAALFCKHGNSYEYLPLFGRYESSPVLLCPLSQDPSDTFLQRHFFENTRIIRFSLHHAIPRLVYKFWVTVMVHRYNTVMKMIYIGATLAIIYQIRFKRVIKATYDADRDTFKSPFLIGGSLVLALLLHEKIRRPGVVHFVIQILWHASIYLESVAILPQLMLIIRTQNIDNLTGNYMFLLGAYRGLYILNWIYRYFTEPHYVHWLVWLAGLVQTGLYADFFYYYVKSWKNNEKLKLPS